MPGQHVGRYSIVQCFDGDSGVSIPAMPGQHVGQQELHDMVNRYESFNPRDAVAACRTPLTRSAS